MKNKLVIIILACFIVIVGVVGFIVYDNRTVSTITLDINPSLEIELDKNSRIKKISALNSDAKDVVDNIKEKDLDLFFEKLKDNLDKKGYTSDRLVILMYTKGDIDKEETKNIIFKKFNDVDIEIISVDNITEEDIKLAKKYNITASKAAYINSISKKNNIKVDNLLNRNIKELKETSESGNYCDNGYILEGSLCLKEINSYNANTGDVCPRGYYEYEGNCYEEVPSQESGVLSCVEDFSLKDGNCVRNVYEDAEAEYSCSKGELVKKGDLFMIGISDAEKMVCVDKSNAKPPTLRCLTHNHTMIDGKCANGPKPTINGGCEPGDYLVNGGCYDIDNEDQWVCPSGNIYEKSKGTYVDLCPDTFTFIDPILKGYTCSDDFKLVDNKCVKEEYREVTRERACPSGYNLVNNDRCINTNKVVSKQNGYYCNDNARLVGDKCVIYEEIEAKHN